MGFFVFDQATVFGRMHINTVLLFIEYEGFLVLVINEASRHIRVPVEHLFKTVRMSNHFTEELFLFLLSAIPVANDKRHQKANHCHVFDDQEVQER